MADYYADGTASGGLNNGSQSDPWEGAAGLQTLLDTLTAGDTGYIRNTFTLTAPLDIDQNSGNTSATINLIGTNGSWVVDGTQARIDANATTNCVIYANTFLYWRVENIVFEKATGTGVEAGAAISSANTTFQNCHFFDNGAHGFDGEAAANASGWLFVRCRFTDNDSYGLYGRSFTFPLLCESRNNGSLGMYLSSGSCAMNCFVSDNGGIGGIRLISFAVAANCVCDDNTGDGLVTAAASGVIGCRATNNSEYGIDPLGVASLYYNYFNGNTLGTIKTPANAATEIDGVETNLTTGSEGYEDADNGKYNLILGAAGYRTIVAIGDNNQAVFARGVSNVPIVHPREN